MRLRLLCYEKVVERNGKTDLFVVLWLNYDAGLFKTRIL